LIWRFATSTTTPTQVHENDECRRKGHRPERGSAIVCAFARVQFLCVSPWFVFVVGSLTPKKILAACVTRVCVLRIA
jgi:hypothetical protein